MAIKRYPPSSVSTERQRAIGLIPGERLVAKCYAGSMNQKATVLKSNLLL